MKGGFKVNLKLKHENTTVLREAQERFLQRIEPVLKVWFCSNQTSVLKEITCKSQEQAVKKFWKKVAKMTNVLQLKNKR